MPQTKPAWARAVDTKLPRYSKAAASIKGRLTHRRRRHDWGEIRLRPLVVEFTKLYPEVSYEIRPLARHARRLPQAWGMAGYNVGVMSLRATTAEEEADIKKNADS